MKLKHLITIPLEIAAVFIVVWLTSIIAWIISDVRHSAGSLTFAVLITAELCFYVPWVIRRLKRNNP